MNAGAEPSPGRRLMAPLAILLATAAALLIAGSGHEPAESGPRTATAVADPAELVRLSLGRTPSVAGRVARIRALQFEATPEPEVITSERLTGIELREIERTGAAEGVAADEATVRMLGLLEPTEELEDAVGASGELAAAAYDTRADRLYVISDAVSADQALVEFVLAHELTHALEDQRFGLPDPNAASNDDRALAQLALSEGTATAMMVEYASAHLNPFELGAATAGLDAGTGDVPGFVIEQLEWAYLGGMEFVNSLRAVADGWKLVDYSLGSRPPASTEQVLHPEKYIRDERPAAVAIDGSALLDAGWRRADRGVAGEFSTRQLLELGGDPALAERAAAGWGGDRYELWRRSLPPSQCTDSCRDELVLALRWRLDSAKDARELAQAVVMYVEDGLGGSSQGPGVWAIEGGSAAAARIDNDLTLVFAPDAALAESVASPSGLVGGAD